MFVAINDDEEARSEAFMKLYADKAVVAQSEFTVNVVGSPGGEDGKKKSRFAGMSVAEHRAMYEELCRDVVRVNDQGVTATPQHAWVHPDGTVLFTVPYEMTKEELLWCFAAARRAVAEDPTRIDFPKGARPPRRLSFSGDGWSIDGDDRGRGLTPDELEQELAALKRGGVAALDRARWGRVLFTDEKAAHEYANSNLGSGWLDWMGGDFLRYLIHAIGAVSPRSFHPVLADFLKHKEAGVRHEVAVAYEQLAAPDALKTVRSGYKGAKEPQLRGAWLRALAATGHGDKRTRKAVLDAATDEDDVVRRSAIVALGHLDWHADVRAFLVAKLGASQGPDGLAAAVAMALTRDPYFLETLERAAKDREGTEVHDGLQRALTVLRGADAAALSELAVECTGDDLERERVFFGGTLGFGARADDGD